MANENGSIQIPKKRRHHWKKEVSALPRQIKQREPQSTREKKKWNDHMPTKPCTDEGDGEA